MNRKKGFTIGLAMVVAAICIGAGAVVRVNQLASTVSSPQVVSASTSPLTLFSYNNNQNNNRIIVRTVQNSGILPVLYAINYTNVDASNYHGVLAGGQSLRDGLGSVLDLSSVPYEVTFVTESGTSELVVVELIQ